VERNSTIRKVGVRPLQLSTKSGIPIQVRVGKQREKQPKRMEVQFKCRVGFRSSAADVPIWLSDEANE
jgi:hypothetical protein